MEICRITPEKHIPAPHMCVEEADFSRIGPNSDGPRQRSSVKLTSEGTPLRRRKIGRKGGGGRISHTCPGFFSPVFLLSLRSSPSQHSSRCAVTHLAVEVCAMEWTSACMILDDSLESRFLSAVFSPPLTERKTTSASCHLKYIVTVGIELNRDTFIFVFSHGSPRA